MIFKLKLSKSNYVVLRSLLFLGVLS